MLRALHHFRFLLLALVFLPAIVWMYSPQPRPAQDDDLLTDNSAQEAKPLLPSDSKLHFAFAAASAAVFISAGVLLLRRDQTRTGTLLATAAFTGTLGVVLLLAFQQFAANSTRQQWTGGRDYVLLHYLVQGIAYSYSLSNQNGGNILLQLAGYIFGVGLCEEITKLLPVLYLLHKNPQTSARDARLLGFISGVGFGVAEGIIYSQQQYNGAAPAMIYVVRFVSCVGLHALLTATAAGYVAKGNLSWDAGAWKYFRGLVWTILPLMVLHAAYDTFAQREFAIGALGCELILFLLFAIQIEGDQPSGPIWRLGTWRRLLAAPVRQSSGGGSTPHENT